MLVENPLLKNWNTPYKIAPFDEIKDDHFTEALEKALAEELREIQAISDNPNPATFTNTILAILKSGKLLNRVLSVFYTLVSADANEQREKLMMEFAPKLAVHSSIITSNEKLFNRIQDLFNRIDSLNLSAEEKRLLEKIYQDFVRAGAALSDKNKEAMKEIQERLSTLGTKFSQNLLADERSWFLELEEKDEACLPDFLVNAARKAAEEKGTSKPIINLSRSLIIPFLQFSPNRELRKKAQEAWASRGEHGEETDNSPIARETLALRRQMANLLGYTNFAEFKLEEIKSV